MRRKSIEKVKDSNRNGAGTCHGSFAAVRLRPEGAGNVPIRRTIVSGSRDLGCSGHISRAVNR
jgi:hypothetical protein